MKKLSAKLLVIVCFLISPMVIIHAQNEIDYNAEGGMVQFNIFDFEGSEKYEIKLPLNHQMDKLNIEIKAYISLGELSIEIYDPAGERQGNFSVRGQINQNKPLKKNEIRRGTEMITTRMRIDKDPWIFNEENFKNRGMGSKVAQASISRPFRNPILGDWTIKIICKDAKGLFTVENNDRLLKEILPTKFANGTVLDTKSRPVQRATVSIKGISGSTVTDNNGEFTVPLRDSLETLVVSYKGMIPKEVAIGNQTKLSVILQKK